MRHDFDDGKYTVIFDEKTGKMEALRHGSPWQELSGNNLIYFMLSAVDTSTQTVAQLQARVAELEAALRIARQALEKISEAESEVFDADDTREMVTVAMDEEEMQKIAETALREAF